MPERTSNEAQPGGRKVLVISSVERPHDSLRRALGEGVGELRVVVPTVRQSRLQWLTNDEDAVREEADKAASDIADALPAADAEAAAGDADPLQAAEDALREFSADELVVVTRPDEEATWLEEGRGADIEASFPGVRVTRLVVSDEE